jgi:HEAT repeat protein
MAPLQPDEGSEDANVTRIRQRVIELSLNGEFQVVTEYLEHPEPDVRATALRVLDNEGKLEKGIVERSLSDSAFKVRNALAYLISRNRDIPAMKFLLDEDAEIVEVACWGIGERGDASAEVLDVLQSITESHSDSLCRESAVAALGALGNRDALGSILKAVEDIATVRRRAVLALAPFDGPEVELAIAKALEDRDWQVRQAAEDISK